jgi:hypothetical protein
MSEGLFRYDEAFARNIGWVTEAEQAALRASGSPSPVSAVWAASIS